jgi:hypothetical protein
LRNFRQRMVASCITPLQTRVASSQGPQYDLSALRDFGK